MTALLPTQAASPMDFVLPPGAQATAPPERRGLRRDGVRMLVASPSRAEHRVFRDLPDLLEPGDVVVVNTSATVPAALSAVRSDGRPALVHVSTPLDDGEWVIEVRQPGNVGPASDVTPGESLRLPAGLRLDVTRSYPVTGRDRARLWAASPRPATPLLEYLSRHGQPIRYDYLSGAWPLSDLQTVYATQPGSAEMPSAGRPFSPSVLVRLMANGVPVVPVVLHAGVSSPEAHEPPLPERFRVPDVTARLVNATHAAGRRVLAVGTTVVRALETASDSRGTVRASRGWTDLVLGPDRPARVVDALITGLHAPGASHLLLLEAVVGRPVLAAAYAAALERSYLWHEFGDVTLLLR